jgi:hypothetical protein
VGADKGLGNSALIELIHRARIIKEQEPLVLSVARKQCAARAALVRTAPQPGEGGGFAAAWRLACAVHCDRRSLITLAVRREIPGLLTCMPLLLKTGKRWSASFQPSQDASYVSLLRSRSAHSVHAVC